MKNDNKFARTGKGDYAAIKILEASKELFYENGFYDTTVANITKKAGVNNGLFTYYFGTKTKVSEIINEDFRANFRKRIDELLTERLGENYPMEIGLAVEYRQSIELYYKHPKLRRFSIETQTNALNHPNLSYTDIMQERDKMVNSERALFYKKQKELINPDISDLDLQTYEIAGIACTTALLTAYHNRILDCSRRYLGDKYIEICFSLLGLDKERIEEITEKSYEINQGLSVHLEHYFIIK